MKVQSAPKIYYNSFYSALQFTTKHSQTKTHIHSRAFSKQERQMIAALARLIYLNVSISALKSVGSVIVSPKIRQHSSNLLLRHFRSACDEKFKKREPKERLIRRMFQTLSKAHAQTHTQQDVQTHKSLLKNQPCGTFSSFMAFSFQRHSK